MQILHALLSAILGTMLLGWAMGIMVNHQINLMWAIPITLFVVAPALFVGAWVAFQFR